MDRFAIGRVKGPSHLFRVRHCNVAGPSPAPSSRGPARGPIAATETDSDGNRPGPSEARVLSAGRLGAREAVTAARGARTRGAARAKAPGSNRADPSPGVGGNSNPKLEPVGAWPCRTRAERGGAGHGVRGQRPGRGLQGRAAISRAGREGGPGWRRTGGGGWCISGGGGSWGRGRWRRCSRSRRPRSCPARRPRAVTRRPRHGPGRPGSAVHAAAPVPCPRGGLWRARRRCELRDDAQYGSEPQRIERDADEGEKCGVKSAAASTAWPGARRAPDAAAAGIARRASAPRRRRGDGESCHPSH